MTTSSNKARFAIFLAGAAAVLVTALPQVAHAQRRSPLADAPAIRKRLELRETRFEIGVGWTSTIGQDYFHSQLVGGRLAFHISDWFAIAAVGGFGAVQLETAYHERLTGSLVPNPNVAREPSATEAENSMQRVKWMAAAQLEFTPFTGKYSLFGKIFAHYDFYAFAGPGFLGIEPTNAAVPACSDAGTSRSCGMSGAKLGGNVGLGLHTFFNQFVALNVELRDVIAKLNPSGRDTNGDSFARLDDATWQSTYMVTGNIMFFFPTVAAISP
jgi:outer membrane beta-barrel protein